MSFLRLLLRTITGILPLAYMGFIWYLSGRPSDAVIVLGFYDSIIKEGLHLVEFAILYGLLVLAMLTRGELTHRANLVAVLVAVAYAFMDELHQFFIPSRSASIVDIIKDMIGITVTWYIIRTSYFGDKVSWLGKFLRLITAKLATIDSEQSSR